MKKNLPDFRDLKKILVIRLDVLGDLLMTIPMIRELRRNAPKAQIDKKMPIIVLNRGFCYNIRYLTSNLFDEQRGGRIYEF